MPRLYGVDRAVVWYRRVTYKEEMLATASQNIKWKKRCSSERFTQKHPSVTPNLFCVDIFNALHIIRTMGILKMEVFLLKYCPLIVTKKNYFATIWPLVVSYIS
jgi:hypothetical protein